MAEADRLFDEAWQRFAAADPAGARERFRLAAEAGRSDAAMIHNNLAASGVGGLRDWLGALARLAELAEEDAGCARDLAILGQMSLTEAGDPRSIPSAETVCEAPDIRAFRALFSPAECRYLAEAAAPRLAPAQIVDVATGRPRHDPIRVCDACNFTWALESPAVHALNRRLAAASGTLPEQGEPLQILRYRRGGEYKPHFDSIPSLTNQRAWTVIVWLSDDYEGGETWFVTPKLALKGQAGDAILFRNTGPDGRRDPATAHAGLPVTKGEKIIASRWIRERPYEIES